MTGRDIDGPAHMLVGRRLLVTGAGGGIGQAIVARLRQAGGMVVGTDVRAPLAGCRQDDRRQDPDLIIGDVAHRDAAHAIVSDAARHMGGIDGIVHCAMWMRYAPLDQIMPDDLHRMMAIGVGAPLWCTQAARPYLSQGGSIVHLSSVAALRGSANCAAYGAAKGAITALTRHLAAELGPDGIRVNAIAPGFVDTPSARRKVGEERIARREGTSALGRCATAPDVANLAAFLLSDQAQAISGETFVIDGGRNATMMGD
ncbi:SDR family oxidoreductase [Sphingobium sp.]|uniref:SDR family oxidoreductase n=1 Tax=Sphingobium sp. TaxID=1912891 RepID=UPI003B3B5299